jgi:hypothetical protein
MFVVEIINNIHLLFVGLITCAKIENSLVEPTTSTRIKRTGERPKSKKVSWAI